MGKFIDLTGQKFGRLTVLDRTPRRPRAWWRCACECGNETEASGELLHKGDKKSCGCLGAELIVALGKSRRKHAGGWKGSEQFILWKSMKSRCYCKGNTSYKWYGAKGIGMCDRWRYGKEGLANFIADMWPRPEGTTLDRKVTADDYCPDNCKWSTQAEQSRNTTVNNNLTVNGRTQCAKDWAHEAGIKYTTLLGRLQRGWAHEEAVYGSIDKSCRRRSYELPPATEEKAIT